MAGYSLCIRTSAAKEIEALSRREDRRRIVERIQGLAGDPRPHGSEKLAGASGLYRVRVGPWRILYAIDDERAVIDIVKIGHRREVYR